MASVLKNTIVKTLVNCIGKSPDHQESIHALVYYLSKEVIPKNQIILAVGLSLIHTLNTTINLLCVHGIPNSGYARKSREVTNVRGLCGFAKYTLFRISVKLLTV